MGNRQNHLSPQWKGPAWAVDSNWRWLPARIASTHPRTCFALPEVKLGILPGFGGTQRLPRLIGVPAALDMITTGKTIFPRQALRMGLVEEMVTSIPSNVRTLERFRKKPSFRPPLRTRAGFV